MAAQAKQEISYALDYLDWTPRLELAKIIGSTALDGEMAPQSPRGDKRMDQKASNDPIVVAVCRSSGGIPKLPQTEVRITPDGIEGDAHDHDKHNKPTRALALVDEEILDKLRAEGYDVSIGSIGENITLRNVHVQRMPPGAVLQMGEVLVRLEEPRRPCFVLDAIDEQLKTDIVGRCGYMASVVQAGRLTPGVAVECLGEDTPADATT